MNILVLPFARQLGAIMRIATLALLATSLSASPLDAATVLLEDIVGSPQFAYATGIQDLVVNGVHCDVAFTPFEMTFNETFGTGDPPPIVPMFFFDPTGATAAANAIATALVGLPIIPPSVNLTLTNSIRIDVPTRWADDPEDFFRAVPVKTFGVWQLPVFWTVGGEVTWGRDSPSTLAVFTLREPVAIPEPAAHTAWLGLFGLGVAAWSRRRLPR